MSVMKPSSGVRSNKSIKTKQWIVLGAIASAIAVASSIGAYMTTDSAAQRDVLAVDKPTTKTIGGGVSDVDKEAFRVQINNQVSDVTKRLAELDQQNKDYKAENERIQAERKTEREQLQQQIENARKEASALAQRTPVAPPPPAGGFTGNNPFTGQGAAPQPPGGNRPGNFLGIGPDGRPVDGSGAPGGSRIVREKLDTSSAPANVPPGANTTTDLATGQTRVARAPNAENDASGKPQETYIPSGSYVRAVLLNGLDAPTGGNSQQTPHPVLLRLVDTARLPNGVKNDLKDCVITANGYGDVASERAYIRADRISCIDGEGNAVDARMTGYVAGEDGKTGLRGRIVQKTGQLLSNALLAGIGSGIGNAFRAGGVSTVQSPLTGATTETTTDAFKSGVGTGVSKAFDLLAQYYIKLAEKTFPIIEVDAGRVVDVVFQQGISLERN